MKLSQLAFIVTDDCNFRCSYCPQRKQEFYIKLPTIEKAINFFYPFLEEDAYIVFYGGEPLLAFDAIQYAVTLIGKKDQACKTCKRFSLTTNGSLVTDEMLEFFHSNRFEIMLSFDGLTQDIGRKAGSWETMEGLIRRIQQYPGITLSVNSIFSPATVSSLSASLKSIMETGVTELAFDLADNLSWNEKSLTILEAQYNDLRHFLVTFYKEYGFIPVKSFRIKGGETSEETTFTCAGGRRRMAIAPDEYVWGCYVFHGLLRGWREHPDFDSYSFGKLDDVIKDFARVYARGVFYYDALSQEYFRCGDRQCLGCEDVNSCCVCPVNAAVSTSSIGKIPAWVCRLNRVQNIERIRFLQDIERISLAGQDQHSKLITGGYYG